MDKKYFYLVVLFITIIGAYCVGKYNNSQRYIFKDNSSVILDTYTGDIYFNGKQIKLLRDKKNNSEYTPQE